MTETDAKKCACPIFQAASIISISAMPVGVMDASMRDSLAGFTRCIGSDCMMWRETMRADSESDPTDPALNFVIGHCGLAGKL